MTQPSPIEFAGDEPEERAVDRFHTYAAIVRVLCECGISLADRDYMAERIVAQLFPAKVTP